MLSQGSLMLSKLSLACVSEKETANTGRAASQPKDNKKKKNERRPCLLTQPSCNALVRLDKALVAVHRQPLDFVSQAANTLGCDVGRTGRETGRMRGKRCMDQFEKLADARLTSKGCQRRKPLAGRVG